MKGVGILLRTLGDCVLINTLARNIKIKYPDMELSWMLEEKYSGIIKYNPDISNVITIKSMGEDWDKVLDEIVKDYDEVFFVQQTQAEDGIWHQVDKYRFKHMIDFYAGRIGIELIDRGLKWYSKSDSEPVKKEPSGKKKIVCHSQTLGKLKDWSKFPELVKELNKLDVEVFQIGLKTDLDLVVEEAKDLREKLSFSEIANFLKGSDCFIGLDSGLSFISAAVGTPTLCIMGASVPTTSGPYGQNVTHILSLTRKECEDRRCHAFRGICQFGSPCIENISVNLVLDAVKKILE